MIKRKCKIEKMAENLNKEREGRTDKVMEKKKRERERKEIKKERLLGNFCHCYPCLSSVLKRISKLLDFKKKEGFRFFLFFFFVFVDFKRKQLEANAVTSNHPLNPDAPLGEGRS